MLAREVIAPVSYIFGRDGDAPCPDSGLLRSGVELRSHTVRTPGTTLGVVGHEHPGQSLDSHAWSDGKESLVFCGDIYNLEFLRGLAHSTVGTRHGFDNVAHVLAVLLRACPRRFLAEANGKFAIAYSGPWGTCLIRDKIGEEQLYYAILPNGSLVYSSSIRSLVPLVPSAGFYTPDSVRVFETPVGCETMFRGIRKLEPGTRVKVDRKGRHVQERYWSIEPRDPADGPDAAFSDQLREILDASLADRIAPKREVSTFLSGGQDSSWINCALTDSGNRPIRAYTTAFRELDSVYDERRHARRVADRCGVPHVVLEPSAEDFVSHFPVTMSVFDEVKANAAHFTEYWIAREAAANGDQVLVSGYGADEILGGEVRYLMMYLDRDRSGNTALINEDPMLRHYAPLSNKLRSVPESAPEWEKYYALMRRGTPKGSEEPFMEIVRGEFLKSDRLVDQCGLADIAVSGQPLLDTAKVDKYWGIDKVCPFLDPRVVDFSFTLPEHLKISGLVTKSVLRDISRGSVPDEITDRDDKVGFAFPHNDPRYAGFLGDLAGSLSRRTGQRVTADSVRGRLDRSVLMAASQELIHRSYAEDPRIPTPR